jgi:3-oxoacyl-[acyl-carrier protein] reductase
MLARILARHGATLALCSRSLDELDAVADELRREVGATVVTGVVDVADVAGVRRWAHEVESALGPAFGLVNNAAIFGPVGRIDEVDLDAWRATLEVDVFGVANLTAAFVPAMVRHGGGSVVNLSGGGVGGPSVPSRASAYTSSKAAVAMLTETLAAELAPEGIRVNAVAPGSTPTLFMSEVLDVGPERAGSDLYEAVVQQQTEVFDLERLERLLVFLLSDESSWLTGKLIGARRDDLDGIRARRAELERSSLFALRRIDAGLYLEAGWTSVPPDDIGSVR